MTGSSAKTPLVSQLMAAPVVTISVDANAHQALDVMNDRHLQHLVVVDAGLRVVGVLSDGDLRWAQPSVALLPDKGMREKALSLLRVGDIMTPQPRTVTPDTPLTAALEKMMEGKLGSMPVVDPSGHAVGIVTGYDVVLLALGLLENAPQA